MTPGSRQVILGSRFRPFLISSLPRLAGKHNDDDFVHFVDDFGKLIIIMMIMMMMVMIMFQISLMVTNNMRPVAEANSVNISQLEPIFLYRDNTHDYCDDRDNQDNRWASH